MTEKTSFLIVLSSVFPSILMVKFGLSGVKILLSLVNVTKQKQ